MSALSNCRDDLARVRAERDELRGTVAADTMEIASLNGDLATAYAAIDGLSNEIRDLEAKLAACEATHELPPATLWRPYADTSIFNTPLPPQVIIDPNSAALCAQVKADNPSPILKAADPWSHPVYWAKDTDPLHTIYLREPWGTSTQGLLVRIPADAKPEGEFVNGADGHIAIIQPDGWEYDFWSDGYKGVWTVIEPLKITASWGGRTMIDGDGLGAKATAAGYGLAAGNIRGEELAAGWIDHALFMVSRHTNGLKLNGATGKGSVQAGPYPACGQRFYLAYTEAELAALPPSPNTTIVKALARYGAYVGDTGGAFVKPESPLPYTTIGLPAPLAQFGNIALTLDWSRLRAVA